MTKCRKLKRSYLFKISVIVICGMLFPSYVYAKDTVNDLKEAALSYFQSQKIETKYSDDILTWEKGETVYYLNFSEAAGLSILSIYFKTYYPINKKGILHNREKQLSIANYIQEEVPFVRIYCSEDYAGDYGAFMDPPISFYDVLNYRYTIEIQNFIEDASMLLKVLPIFVQCLEAINNDFYSIADHILKE